MQLDYLGVTNMKDFLGKYTGKDFLGMFGRMRLALAPLHVQFSGHLYTLLSLRS